MGGWDKRSRRRWLTAELTPRLVAPSHWLTGGMRWQACDFGLVGTPSGWIAQGLGILPSRHGPWFKAHMFIMPLCRPVESPYFSHGLQLMNPAGGSGFDLPIGEDEARVVEELAAAMSDSGAEFLERTGQLAGYRGHLMTHQEGVLAERGVFVNGEEVGYTSLLLGDFAHAEAQLSRAVVPEAGDVPWVTAYRSRCSEVLSLLRQDPRSAQQRLANWAYQSASALGIQARDGLERGGDPW